MEDARNIKTFCCFSKGLSKIRARFEQNTFTVDEQARALLYIDNSDCSAKVKRIKLILKAKLRMISNQNMKRTYNRVVAS